jgi:cytochrome c peroxidase
LGGFLLAMGGVLITGCKEARPKAASVATMDAAKAEYRQGMDSLVRALEQCRIALEHPGDSASARSRFLDARQAFKRQEFLIEYYNKGSIAKLNGAPIPEWDEANPAEPPEPPEGFQVAEALLFPRFRSESLAELRLETERMAAHARYARDYVLLREFDEAHYFDAVMLETARLASKGLSAFDSPEPRFALSEAAAALRGIQEALDAVFRTGSRPSGSRPSGDKFKAAGFPAAGSMSAESSTTPDAGTADAWKDAGHAFERALAPLDSASDFDVFDRARYLAVEFRGLCESLRRLRTALSVGLPGDHRAFRPDAATLFDAGAFDPEAFSPDPCPDSLLRARQELGRMLFFEPLLSGDRRRACASCHRPEKGFSDGLQGSRAFSEGYAHVTKGSEDGKPDRRGAGSGRAGLRNAPGLINAGLQRGYFYDLRVIYLEDQASQVLQNPREMHSLPAEAAGRLWKSPGYRDAFLRAFGGRLPDTASPEGPMRRALAAYVRSLTALDAPFDRYLRGDSAAVDAEAIRGFNLFMGKAKCATCHFPPLFNGTVPPEYEASEKEIIGAPDRPDLAHARLDADPGRFNVYAVPGNRHAFKTPTVRNAALTAPYMHNGVFATLEQVVDFYDRGGGAGLGFDLPNQTLPFDSLGLSAPEKKALIAFMRTLTDTTGLTRMPEKLPSFPGRAEWDKRPIGGIY